MYCYHLNKEESKGFIKYFKENNDELIVYYGDGRTEEKDNSEENKNYLNKIQEKQINTLNYEVKRRIPNLGLTFISFISSYMGFLLLSLASLLPTMPGTNLISAIAVLYFVPFQLCIFKGAKCLISKLTNRKFNLFMKHKEELDTRVYEKEEFVDEKALCPIKKERHIIKNLSINDVHFMKYSELKEITKAINNNEEKEIMITSSNGKKQKVLVKEKQYKR